MKPPDDMEFGDVLLLKSFPRLLGNLLVGELESALFPLETGKGAEFTGGVTDVGVIDVSVDVVVGAVAVLFFADQVGHGPQDIKVVGLKKPKGVRIRQAGYPPRLSRKGP